MKHGLKIAESLTDNERKIVMDMEPGVYYDDWSYPAYPHDPDLFQAAYSLFKDKKITCGARGKGTRLTKLGIKVREYLI